MKYILIILSFFLYLNTSIAEKKKDAFADFEHKTFIFEGHEAHIVFPTVKNENANWVWRARFWAHEPQVDIALLEAGFHVVYVDVANMYGNDSAVALWNNYYDFCIEEYQLNPKVVLEGMSRGGLIIYNWASSNTDKVSTIYADAPVCDFKSWPGGLYEGEGSSKNWQNCLQAYHLDNVSVLNYTDIPIYNCKAVAAAGIPVIHVCGADDTVVPVSENTALVKTIFDQIGTEMKVISKKGVGHHPHSLKDPKPIVNFIISNL